MAKWEVLILHKRKERKSIELGPLKHHWLQIEDSWPFTSSFVVSEKGTVHETYALTEVEHEWSVDYRNIESSQEIEYLHFYTVTLYSVFFPANHRAGDLLKYFGVFPHWDPPDVDNKSLRERVKKDSRVKMKKAATEFLHCWHII